MRLQAVAKGGTYPAKRRPCRGCTAGFRGVPRWAAACRGPQQSKPAWWWSAHSPRYASRDGVMDMAGNVGQWCSDWYEEYTPQAQTDPSRPSPETTGSSGAVPGVGTATVRRCHPSRVQQPELPRPNLFDHGFRVVLPEAGAGKKSGLSALSGQTKRKPEEGVSDPCPSQKTRFGERREANVRRRREHEGPGTIVVTEQTGTAMGSKQSRRMEPMTLSQKGFCQDGRLDRGFWSSHVSSLLEPLPQTPCTFGWCPAAVLPSPNAFFVPTRTISFFPLVTAA